MNIFKKIFGKTDEQPQEKFSEGDIFYVFFDEQYHLYKLLKADIAFETYHVLAYTPTNQLPEKDKLSERDIIVYHFPIDMNGFKDAKLFSKNQLTDNDLIGYYEYLRQTGNIEELVALATKYYQEAYRLTDLKQHEEAIQNYSKAIELLPNFYEAIDNRAFCKMDLARWNDAIEDFNLSLSVYPQSLLAEFSIGECYLKMKKYDEAIIQFEKALTIDPTDQLSKDFLKKATDLKKA